jgi:hypothetical protein
MRELRTNAEHENLIEACYLSPSSQLLLLEAFLRATCGDRRAKQPQKGFNEPIEILLTVYLETSIRDPKVCRSRIDGRVRNRLATTGRNSRLAPDR